MNEHENPGHNDSGVGGLRRRLGPSGLLHRAAVRRSVLAVLFLAACAIMWILPWGGREAGGFAAMQLTIYDQVYDLRVNQQDYVGARALALSYLDGTSTDTQMRQLVHNEYGLAYYDEGSYTLALGAFDDVILLYASEPLDPTINEYRVDDAQFMIGYIEYNFGDVNLGITGYFDLINNYPASDRRAEALFLLAGIYESQGDTTSALSYYDQLALEYPSSTYAPQGQMNAGNIHSAAQNYSLAAAVFQGVVTQWPAGSLAVSALQSANQALIDDQINICCPEPCPGGGINAFFDPNIDPVPCLSDNTPGMNANIATARDVYGDIQATLGMLQGALDLQIGLKKCRRIDPSALNAARIDIVGQMQALAPNDLLTQWANLELAKATFANDPAAAHALASSVEAAATLARDDPLFHEARFTRGQFYMNVGDLNTARQFWMDLLARQLDLQMEGEVWLELGFVSNLLGDPAGALTRFQHVELGTGYGDGLQSSAMFYAAKALEAMGDQIGADQEIDALLLTFPNSTAAAIANAEKNLTGP